MFKPEAYVDSVLDLLDDEQTLVAENIIKNPLDMQERYMSLVPDGLLDFIVKQWRPGMTSDQADKIFRKYSSFNQGGSVSQLVQPSLDGSRPGYGGERLNLKNLPGEENQYIKVFDTVGSGKRYHVQYTKPGYNKRFTVEFTPKGLEEAKKMRDKFDAEYKKLYEGKVADPSISKTSNPPDPKKPWRYVRNTTTNTGQQKKVVEYFANKQEALKAQKEVLKAREEKRFKPITDKEKQLVKKQFEKGKTLSEIAKDNKISLSRVTDAFYEQGLELPDAFINNPEYKKFIKQNYKKLTYETMGKKLFPNEAPSVQRDRAKRIAEKLVEEGELEKLKGGSVIEEIREKYGFNPDENKIKIRKARIEAQKKFSVPSFEKAMQGTKESQLSHMDDLYSQNVKLQTLGYSPEVINQALFKNVDPYFKSLYNKRENLIKNKPQGWQKKVNEINDKGIKLSLATDGYKSFNVIEPGGKSYLFGVNQSKTIDPTGLFKDKTLQDLLPENLKKNKSYINQMIPDPVERFLFLENAKAVQEAQKNVPESESKKIAQNLNKAGRIVDNDFYGFDKFKDKTMTTPEGRLDQKNVPESESKKIAQNLRKAGFKCKFDKGGLALCDNPADYAEDITRQAKLAADKNPAAINKFKNAGNIVRKGISGLSKTGVAAIGELLFAFPFAVMDYTDGLSFQRIIGNVTLGLFGQTEDSEIRSYSGGYQALKAKDFEQKSTNLQDIMNKEAEVSAGNIMLSPDDINLLPSQVEGAEKRFIKALDYYSGPDGYKRFLKDFDNEQKIREEIQKKNLQRSLEREKNVQKSLEGVEPISAFAAASGGLANLTTTIPPKRGPNSQGLASLKKYGKQY
jgi:hypothetical protein